MGGKLRAQGIDSGLAIAQGYVSGYSVNRKFGRNSTVGTSLEAIWEPGGAYNFLQTAAPVRIRSGGDADDTAAGVGARSIVVAGLDANWEECTEELATAGTSASAATTKSFIRVFRAYVSGCGAYGGTNVGDILIETTGGTLLAQITAVLGQTLMAITSVPANHTLYLTRFRAIVGDTNKTASVHMCRRENADVTSAPFGAHRVVATFDDLISANADPVLYRAYTEVAEKSDLWASAVTSTGTSSVAVDFDYILTRNPGD